VSMSRLDDLDVTLDLLAYEYRGSEREWISDLSKFAKASDRHELSVAIEAAVEQHRRAQEMAEAVEHQAETCRRLAAEVRELRKTNQQ
jgi:hypothetical protein